MSSQQHLPRLFCSPPDIVHTLHVLAAIRRALPKAEISWAIEHGSAEILRDNPLLDRLIEVDTKARGAG